MFENMTYELILDRMIQKAKEINPSIDLRQGSIVYMTLASAAMEFMNAYISSNMIMTETFADTSSRDYLIERAKERGITPTAATQAILKGVFTPTNLSIPLGARFSLDKLNYQVVEKIADGQYKLVCETHGEEGNEHFGSLIPIAYIHGLESAELTEVLINGEDEEDTEHLRKRYFQSLEAESFGGNKNDYKAKVGLINGVGGVKVFSGTEWNGGGSVKIVITDSENGMPTQTLIETVQTQIDPITNQGEGIGLAPIGHFVTIVGVNEQTVNVASRVTYQTGYGWDDVKSGAESVLNEYFSELNAAWEDSKNITVRISQIETRLLSVTGIIDVAATTINGVEENCIINSECIVKLGEVNER